MNYAAEDPGIWRRMEELCHQEGRETCSSCDNRGWALTDSAAWIPCPACGNPKNKERPDGVGLFGWVG